MDLDKALEVLREKAAQVETLAAGAAAEIAELNHRLARMDLGLEAWAGTLIQYQGADAQVGYARVAGAWQLAVRLGRGEDKAEPLARAPPFVRLAAIHHLPAVLEALTQRVEALLQAIGEGRAEPHEPAETASDGPHCPCGHGPADHDEDGECVICGEPDERITPSCVPRDQW